MDGSSLINSKASAIKSLLLTAWRCKWSEAEWAHGIRKVLPRGVNGDVYDLADCILKQALIGPAPNQLFISYLNYSIKTKLVSHGSVLAAIARLCDDDLTRNKPLAVICLLEFVKSFRDNISCFGTEEDCIHLCRAIGDIVHWLIKCIYNSIHKICSNSSITSTANTLTAMHLQQQQQTSSNNQQNNFGGNTNDICSTINLNNSHATTNNSPFPNISAYQQPSSEYHQVIELTTEIISYIIGRPFTMALLHICRLEYEQKFQETMKTFSLVEKIIIDPTVVNSIQARENLDVIAKFSQQMTSLDSHPSVVAARQLRNSSTNHGIQHNNRMDSYHKPIKMDPSGQISQHFTVTSLDSSPSQSLFACLYSLIAFDVVLWPARDIKLVANQIATIKDFYNLPLSSAYCEIIRICLIGSVDAKGTTEDGKWAVFTFLKMPHLLKELNKICYRSPPATATNNISTSNTNNADILSSNACNNSNNTTLTQQSSPQYAHDLIKAIEKLIGYSPLLDLADTKCNCDFLGCLVKELSKTESSFIGKLNDIVSVRQAMSKARPTISAQDSGLGLHTVLKAEPTMISILRTLDTDYSKDQAQLLRVFCQMVNGKSFELILSAAAASGRLQTFTSKLIEFNEANRQSNGENGKSSLLRSLLFDTTFLMLCYIANNYGCEVLKPKDRNSTFASWYLRCYNQDTRLNCPHQLLSICDAKKVDLLIKHLMELSMEQNNLQTTNTDWQEVCQNIPSAIKEILNAWQQDFLSDGTIKNIVLKIKSQMCFLGLVIASWLRAYIRTLGKEERKKPLAMLQEFTRSSSVPKYRQQNQSDSTISNVSSSTSSIDNNIAGSSQITSMNATTASGGQTMTGKNNENNNQQAQQEKDFSNQASESYKERSSLMCHIIKKIYNELAPSHLSSNTIFNSNQLTSTLSSTSGGSLSIDTTDSSSNITGNNTTHNSLIASQQLQIHAPSNKRFSCTLSTNEILIANLNQSLERGWTDLRSLHTFEALVKLIGCRSFANQIVERILLLESPSDLNRAVDIVFGLFHLNIEKFALALIEETIVDNLICEQKQLNLIQPRAYALARLSVMTIIEAIRHLKILLTKCNTNNQQPTELSSNIKQQQQVKIKTEPPYYTTGSISNSSRNTNLNKHDLDIIEPMIVSSNDSLMSHINKRAKIDDKTTGASINVERNTCMVDQLPIFVPRKDTKATLTELEASLVTLMRLFKKIMSDTTMSQRTLFPVLFLEQTVICAGESAHDITKLAPSYMLMDIIRLFSNELTFELALAIGNLSTSDSRWATARAICELASKGSVTFKIKI